MHELLWLLFLEAIVEIMEELRKGFASDRDLTEKTCKEESWRLRLLISIIKIKVCYSIIRRQNLTEYMIDNKRSSMVSHPDLKYYGICS